MSPTQRLNAIHHAVQLLRHLTSFDQKEATEVERKAIAGLANHAIDMEDALQHLALDPGTPWDGGR